MISLNVLLQAGDTILIHAVKGGHIEVVRALIDKYADVDEVGAVCAKYYLYIKLNIIKNKF